MCIYIERYRDIHNNSIPNNSIPNNREPRPQVNEESMYPARNSRNQLESHNTDGRKTVQQNSTEPIRKLKTIRRSSTTILFKHQQMPYNKCNPSKSSHLNKDTSKPTKSKTITQ